MCFEHGAGNFADQSWWFTAGDWVVMSQVGTKMIDKCSFPGALGADDVNVGRRMVHYCCWLLVGNNRWFLYYSNSKADKRLIRY